MTIAISSFDDVSDDDLLRHVAHLARQERYATAQLIASLTELDARKLYLREGCASLFTYCTQVLHLSEHAAYGRIEAARAARRLPEILELLANGTITLTTVTLLGPHLTDENHHNLLEAARHKSRREVEQIVARLRPKPDIPASIRKLPEPTLAKSPTAPPTETLEVVEAPPHHARPVAPARPPIVAPLAPARYKMQFTVSDETYQTFRRAQDLLRHTIPNGDPAAIVDRALTMLVEHLEKTKWAATTRPQASRGILAKSRHIPAVVRRAVWARDGGQCTFVGAAGRCTERGCLEFHHVVSFATVAADGRNIVLRCRHHNQYEATQEFPLFVRELVAGYVLEATHRVDTPLVRAESRMLHTCVT